VRNITYDTWYIKNVDYAIELYQCYGQKNLTLCLEYPSRLTISDVVFKNFKGTTNTKYAPAIAAFACSSEAVCSGISATNIDVRSPNGTKDAYCLNVKNSTLDVTCGAPLKGFN
jgi:galacturan 1,4-alpha-galacturonidase